MMTIIEGMPEHVAAIDATGKVTGEDYDNVLIPLVGEKLLRHDKIAVLYVLGPEFSRFTAEAVWDDAKVGLTHLTSFRRIAVVSDVGWVVNAVKFLSFAIPCPVKIFSNDQLPEAKLWVSE